MNDPSKPIEDLRPNALHRFHLFFQWTPNSTKASWEGGWGPFWGHAVAQSIAGPWSMLCVAGAQAPDCAVNIGRQGTGGAVQLNATHFALTWPGGAAVSDDPALHLWVVYKQTLPPATGFLFVGNNNAVWKTSAGGLEMAVSGCTGTVGDRHGDPTLFRYSVATIDATDAWSYVAPIWVGHGLRQGRAECGDYFPLGNRTVAMYSHSGAVVVWMVGDELANGTFVPTATGQADYGVYYASASFEVTTPPSPATAAAVGSTASNRQNEGRRVMWAWVTEERNPPFGGSVWAGVQALPREVTLATDGSGGLSFSPARELQAWRSSTFHHPSVQIAAGGSNVELTDLAADGMQLELRVEIMLAPAPQPGGWNKTTSYYPGLLVRAGGGSNASAPKESTFIGLRPSKLSDLEVTIGRRAIPAEAVPPAGTPYVLRVFVDHSVVTVFTPSGKALTSRVYPSPQSLGVWLVGGGAATTTFNVTAWSMAKPKPTLA